MIDPITAVLIPFLKPALEAAGKAAWEGVSKESKKAYEWLKSKFTKPLQSAALQQAVASPTDDDTMESLAMLINQAMKDEVFKSELLALLPEKTRSLMEQYAVQTGDNSNLVQLSGNSSNVTIIR